MSASWGWVQAGVNVLLVKCIGARIVEMTLICAELVNQGTILVPVGQSVGKIALILIKYVLV